MISDSPVTVGLASYGLSGKAFHAPFLDQSPQFRLTHVLERTSNNAEAKYQGINTVRDYEDLLHISGPELIVVNVPDTLHVEFATRAMRAGKHVIIEKPFTLTVSEAKTLIQIAESEDRVLSVFQNRRWDSDFLTVRKLIDSGMLGRLVEYEAHFDRFRNVVDTGKWRENMGIGHGALYNLGSHLIDQALVLFGLPDEVYGELRIQRTGGSIDDNFEIILHYSALKVTLKVGTLVRANLPRYILLGEQGGFVKYGMDVQEEQLRAGMRPDNPAYGIEPSAQHGHLDTTINSLHVQGPVESIPGDYKPYFAGVFKAVREGIAPPVTGTEGMHVIAVIEAVLKSNAEGCRVKFNKNL
ncbi:MAG: Gfo/Idh/MocA family oxidoreductase [Bacteroidota bacterium]